MRSTKNIIALICLLAATSLAGYQLFAKESAQPSVDKSALELRAEEGLYYYNGTPFSGTAITYLENGTLFQSEQMQVGKKEGLLKRWFPNGLMSYEANYQAGRLHGSVRSWWSNGQLRSEAQLNKGVADGLQRQWYQSGFLFKEINLKDGKEEGLQKAWRENGKLYNNYEAVNGRIFGLKRANLCFELKDEAVQYAD